jgi:hypothetical protein
MSGPALDASWVLLSPGEVAYADRALQLLGDQLRRDGLGRPDSLAVLTARLATARGFANETAKARKVPAVAELSSCNDDTSNALIGVLTASELLACSAQWTRRMCASGALATARRVSGRWLVERSEIESIATERGRA